ncbi:MAG: hypothetical protein WC652_04785 [archaeon]|jgi:hypothetical protein
MSTEENNPLLVEIRQGIGNNQNTAQQEKSTSVQVDSDTVKEEMTKILAELKKKMTEIDKITAELEEKRNEMNKPSPKKTEKILQEIKVPPLELLK